jgi:uncharacterized membrane protein HdeD (DUF308 family)
LSTETIKPEEITTPWWLILLEGIAAIIVGVLLWFSTGTTLFVLVQVLGIYWLIKGILEIASIFIDRSQWGWKLFIGILSTVAGIIVIQHPFWSTLLVPATIAILVGIAAILIGIGGLIRAFQGAGWGVGTLAVLAILMGVLILANPLYSAALTPFILGGFMVVGGIAAVIQAFRVK